MHHDFSVGHVTLLSLKNFIWLPSANRSHTQLLLKLWNFLKACIVLIPKSWTDKH